jgi:hypothetical protein
VSRVFNLLDIHSYNLILFAARIGKTISGFDAPLEENIGELKFRHLCIRAFASFRKFFPTTESLLSLTKVVYA